MLVVVVVVVVFVVGFVVVAVVVVVVVVVVVFVVSDLSFNLVLMFSVLADMTFVSSFVMGEI